MDPTMLDPLLLLVLLVSVGWSVGESAGGKYRLHSGSGLVLTSYSTSHALHRRHCAVLSIKASAPGFGVRNSSDGGVDCFISDQDTLATAPAATEQDAMLIFELAVEGVPFPATLREPGGGILDTPLQAGMLFRAHPFPSAGRVVRVQVGAQKTEGTLHLAIYQQSVGTSDQCGEYERLRWAQVPRNATGMLNWEFEANELTFESGEFYGFLWGSAGGGIVPFVDSSEPVCFHAADVLTGASTPYWRTYDINVYVAYD